MCWEARPRPSATLPRNGLEAVQRPSLKRGSVIRLRLAFAGGESCIHAQIGLFARWGSDYGVSRQVFPAAKRYFEDFEGAYSCSSGIAPPAVVDPLSRRSIPL